MKRLLLILVLCVLLSGCAEVPQPHFCVTCSEIAITLDAPAEPVLSALGVPFGYGERKSSRGRGVEKIYRFSGLRLITYESREGERILGVTITARGQQTPEGIAVGDSAAQVRQCFGPEAIQEGRCTLRRSGERMEVRLQNNVVTSIAYSLI